MSNLPTVTVNNNVGYTTRLIYCRHICIAYIIIHVLHSMSCVTYIIVHMNYAVQLLCTYRVRYMSYIDSIR